MCGNNKSPSNAFGRHYGPRSVENVQKYLPTRFNGTLKGGTNVTLQIEDCPPNSAAGGKIYGQNFTQLEIK